MLLGIIPLTINSCENEIPAGLQTIAKGQVLDSVKNKTLAWAKVVLSGCHGTFYGLSCSNIIDSVRTNNIGEFEITFTTDGKDKSYEISVFEDEDFIFSSAETIKIGQANSLTLYATELSILKVKLEIDNNSVGPIRLITPGGNHSIINKNTRDTIIYGKVIPKYKNRFTFDAYDPSISAVDKYRKSRDTLDIDLRDTTYFVKKITDPKLWSTGR